MRRKFLAFIPFGLIKLAAQTKLDTAQVPTQQQISINFSSGEIPGGLPNGILATFTLAHAPINNSLMLFRNGLCQLNNVGTAGDYSLIGSMITFQPAAIPMAGDVLQAFYRF